MEKKKLEIIELNLGISADIDDKDISPETQENIDREIRLSKRKTDTLKRIKDKREKEQSQKQKIIDKCYKLLLRANEKNEKVSAVTLVKNSGDLSLSTLIQSINRYSKQRGGLWKIKKSQIKGKSYYTLTST